MRQIGIIPAAGKGNRLKLLFSKELYPIPKMKEYFPVILSNVLALKSISILEIIIVISPDKVDILKFLGNGNRFGVSINYVVQEHSVSLPDAIAKAADQLRDKEVYFLMADTFITQDDFLVVFNERVNRDFDISLGCFVTTNPGKFSTLTFQNGKVNFCEDKNPNSSSNIMWGFWRWNKEFTNRLISATLLYSDDTKEQTMTDILQDEIKSELVEAVVLKEHHYWDLGTFDEIELFLKTILRD